MNKTDSKDLVAMNQVRDLLFGTQLKDIDTRFQRQDARFQREVNDAREALKNRLDSLENFMRSETASLLNRINADAAERNAALEAERRERAEALNALAGNLSAAEKEFERRVNTLSNLLDTTGLEIRKLMQTETSNLNKKIDEKYEAALNVLSETASQIRHDMVYRSMISSMFMEMGAKLNNQWLEDPVEVIAGQSQHDAFENREHNQPDEDKLP